MDQTLTVWETQPTHDAVHLKMENKQYPVYCVISVIIYSFIYWIRRTLVCLRMLKTAMVGSGRAQQYASGRSL